MKQLTIFCSLDLEDRVVAALDRPGIDGYVELGRGVARRFAERGQAPRTIAWEAVVLQVPAADDHAVREVIEQLRKHAADCEIAPCLRLVVSPVEEVH